jgi:hypothetical protein
MFQVNHGIYIDWEKLKNYKVSLGGDDDKHYNPTMKLVWVLLSLLLSLPSAPWWFGGTMQASTQQALACLSFFNVRYGKPRHWFVVNVHGFVSFACGGKAASSRDGRGREPKPHHV